MDWLLATIILVGLTFIPALELRFSIPVGILATTVHLPFFGTIQGFNLPWWYVFLICVLANILLAAIVYKIILLIIHKLLLPNWKWFAKLYHKRVEKLQKKIHKQVERWGWIGLALFIAVPLPGSGVYSGGIVAYALGFSFKKYMMASALGVLIAATVITLLTMGISFVF
jgi:uncharacterized membrane protein